MKEIDARLQPLVNDYDNEIFWSELSSRLAKRDLPKMGAVFSTHDDYMKRFFEVEKEYEEEFVEHGLQNVKWILRNNIYPTTQI